MAKCIWRGDAPAVSQVIHVTPTAPVAGTVYTVSFTDGGTKSISYTCTSTSVASAVAGLVAAWNASANGEFAEVTASSGSTHMILTADTAGVAFGPITIAASGTTSSGDNEVQQFVISSATTTGTFTITFDGCTTGALDYNTNAALVLAELEALTSIGAGNIDVSETTSGTFQLTYQGTLSNANQSLISATSYLEATATIAVTSTDGSPGNNQQLAITLPDGTTDGTFRLQWAGTYSTGAIQWDATPGEIKAALEALPGIGYGNVTASGTGPWTIEFINSLAGTNVVYTPYYTLTGSATAGYTSLTRPTSIIIDRITGGGGGNNEIQRLIVNPNGNPALGSGTYTLTFDGYTTSSLSYNANASQVQAALTALTSIGSGNIAVTYAGSTGYTIYLAEFGGTMANAAQNLITANTANLVCYSPAPTVDIIQSAAAGTNEVQTITCDVIGATTGTFTLTFEGYTTAALDYNATAADVQVALRALTSIGAGNVSVSGTGLQGGGFSVTFQGALGYTNVAEITAETNITGIAAVAISTITPGSAPTGGGTSTATANSGPNDASVAANWSGNAVPTDGDEIILQDCSVDILYGLDYSAITPSAFKWYSSYSGKVGLPRMNEETAGYEYLEYRDRYFTTNCATFELGIGDGDGTERFYLDVGTTTNTTVSVFGGLNRSTNAGVETMLIKGGTAASVLNVTKGEVGVAVYDGETAQFPTLRVGNQGNVGGDTFVRIGNGVTLGEIAQFGGVLETYSGGWSTLDLVAGDFKQYDGNIGTATIREGTFYHQTDGSATSITIWPGGALEMSRDMRPVTITACYWYEGGKLNDPAKRGTYTTLYTNGRITADLNVGESRQITFTA